MKRSVLLAMLVALLCIAVGGCGDDASDDDDTSEDAGANDSGGTDPADGGGGSGGSRSTPTVASGSVQCGSSSCSAPAGGFAMACCAEESSGTCGMSVMGNACTKPAAGDDRCPSVSIMGALMLPSCCSPEGLCGIDPSMFGMPGCVDLKSAAERSGMMGGGFQITFPEPRRCDGSSDEGDDGDDADDGDGTDDDADDDTDDADDDTDDADDETGDTDAGTEDDAGS